MKIRSVSTFWAGPLMLLAALASGCGPGDAARESALEEAPIGQTRQAVIDYPLTPKNEPYIVVNPVNPANMAVVVYYDIRVSTNGGQTWTTGGGANFPPGASAGGDSSAGFDSNGQLFWTQLGSLSSGGYDIFVQKVDPTTGAPIGTAADVSAQGGFTTGSTDKQWISADRFPGSPYKNNLYVVWAGDPDGDVGPKPGGMYFSRSTNGGVNWTPSALLVSDPSDADPRMIHTAVGADGAVYIAYHSVTSAGGNPDGISGRIIVKRSDNGGVSFPAANKWNAFAPGLADMTYNVQYFCSTPDPHNAGVCLSGTPNVPRRLFHNQDVMLGSAQAFILPDPTDPQKIAVVASDDPTNTTHGAGFDDASVYIARSTNKGASWGAPTQVDSGPGTSLQMMPTASMDLSSKCTAFSYYDTRGGVLNASGNTMLDLYVRGSSDGGITFGPEVKLDDASLDPDLNAPSIWVPNSPLPSNYVYTHRIGEYNGIALAHGVAHAVFTRTDAGGNQQVFYDDVRVCSDPSLPPPNGHIVGARQSTNVTSVFSVGTDGALYIRWFFSGAWHGPAAMTSANFAPPGAPLAVGSPPGSNELDVFVVGNDGRVNRVFETNDGAWQVATALTAANFAAPGAHLATGVQSGTQLDLFVVDTAGRLQSFNKPSGFPWSSNAQIAAAFAPSGAPVTTAKHPGADQIDVYAVASNGAINATWAVGFGLFTLPTAITATGVASPGGHVATGMQGTTQLDIFYAGVNGSINSLWVINSSPPFGPVALTSASFMPSAGELSTIAHGTNQLDLFAVSNAGATNVLSVVGLGAWSGPTATTVPADAVPGASITATSQGTSQLDLFTMGNLYVLEATGSTSGSAWGAASPLLP